MRHQDAMDRKDMSPSQSEARQSICNAALALIKQGGEAKVSMRAIADALGSSAMMPYNYFAGKDELLLELRRRLFHDFAEALAREPAGDALERLRGVIRAYIAYGLEKPDEYRLLFNSWNFGDYRKLRAKYSADYFRNREPWDILCDSVEAVLPGRSADDVNGRVHLLWCLLHGLISLHLSHKFVFGMQVDDLIEPAIGAAIDVVTARAD